MDKKEAKHFFKPTWKKFIIPLVLILLLLVLVSNFNAIGTFLDKYSCESEALYSEYDQYKKTNNTEGLNQTEVQIKELGQRMVRDAPQGGIVPIISLYTVGVIDPLVPFPCLMIEGESPFCQFYVNETTHACMVKSIENTKLEDFNNTALRDIKFSIRPYINPSATILIVNIIVLIIEGYLISVLIQFIYTKQKNKKSANKKTN
ncbi:MAG: hypothetical protein HY512_03100 [Candidatus Aenigmarchaeota archaeon]|nr:hypothetical protein [Candidatus Aenigmarchaeota archaeon]